jgi:hypothetical protein
MMASPFPGMNPHLEVPEIWRGFHLFLANEIVRALNAIIGPKYFANAEVRTVFEESGVIMSFSDVYPDASIFELIPTASTGIASTQVAIPAAPVQRPAVPLENHKLITVEVRETESKRLVTAIEILSPVNKRGKGLQAYHEKRLQILQSNLNLVELDFLRAGQRVAWEVIDPPIECDYLVLVNRAFQGSVRQSEIWPVDLDEPLPLCPVPLLPPDPDAPLNLTEVLQRVDETAAYERWIDYTQAVPPPPLRPSMAEWLERRQSEGVKG